MRRFIILFAGLAATAAMLVPFAQADVARNQVESATLTVSLAPVYPGNIHIYDIVVSPCDGSFTGSATAASVLGATETITGTLAGGNLNFVATYLAFLPGYHYDYSGAFAGGTAFDFFPNGSPYTPSFVIANSLSNVSFSTYKNHGDYVSSQPKGSRETAAQSCIGKPVQSS